MSAPAADLKAAAHEYAQRGWRVLPLHFIRGEECSCRDGAVCKSAGKHPILKGWQDRASTSGADIEEWWSQRPRAGVGIATGEQSGLFVLDVDPDNGGLATLAALERAHGPLPYTRTIRTGSGGKHLYFNWPGGAVTNSAGKLGPGLDIRGNGGQVVAPPSRSNKGDYVLSVDAPVVDAPAWLLDLLRPPEPKKPTTGGTPYSPEGANHYAEAALADELAQVEAAGEGTHNHQLYRSACNLGELIGCGALDRIRVFEALVAASTAAGYPQRDSWRQMENTIVGGLDKGELNPRDPWPPVGTATGPTEEEIAAIRAIYGENSPEMDWLAGHSSGNGSSAVTSAGTAGEHLGTPGNTPDTGECDHDNPDVQAHIDALLAEHPDLADKLTETEPLADFLSAKQHILIEAYRSAAGPQESIEGACAMLRRHRATLDHPEEQSPCDVANYWFTAEPIEPSNQPSNQPSSWAPIDLSSILDGTAEPQEPTLLTRNDGHCLLYPGLVHWMQGEPESGKSWVAQHTAAEVLKDRGHVIYIDHESTPHAVVGRLQTLGVSRDDIRRGLRYVQPEVGALKEITAFAALLAGPADLVVIDGVTDALGVDGSSLLDNGEVAAWMRRVPKKLASHTGAAVICVDHVIKNSNGSGRFAIGAQSKLAGVDGAVYTVEPLKPMGRGLCGELVLRIGKDRPGEIRPRCGPYRAGDRTQEAARLLLDSTGDHGMEVTVQAPEGEPEGEPTTEGLPRYTRIMERISKLLEQHKPDGYTQTWVRDHTTGKNACIPTALKVLRAEGYINEVLHEHGRYPLWISVRPYREKTDPVLRGEPAVSGDDH